VRLELTITNDIHLLRRLIRRDTRRNRWAWFGLAALLVATSAGATFAGGVWMYIALLGVTVAIGLLLHAAQTLWWPARRIDAAMLRPVPVLITDDSFDWTSATGVIHRLPWIAVRRLDVWPDRFELVGATGKRVRVIARVGLTSEQDAALAEALTAAVARNARGDGSDGGADRNAGPDRGQWPGESTP
jgi:hypothetical protein